VATTSESKHASCDRERERERERETEHVCSSWQSNEQGVQYCNGKDRHRSIDLCRLSIRFSSGIRVCRNGSTAGTGRLFFALTSRKIKGKFVTDFLCQCRAIGSVCVCQYVPTITFGLMTFDLDIWHAGSLWPYVGQVWRSDHRSEFTVTDWKKCFFSARWRTKLMQVTMWSTFGCLLSYFRWNGRCRLPLKDYGPQCWSNTVNWTRSRS